MKYIIGVVLLMVLSGFIDAFAAPVKRDSHGAIYRSAAQVRKFHLATVCPATHAKTLSCPGFIVDHKNALACARTEEQRTLLDHPWNMQYQSKAQSEAKDRVERTPAACAKTQAILKIKGA
jgi:hypothetical protein